MSGRQSISGVLVGGYKPEDIQREYLARKEKEDAERKRAEEEQRNKAAMRTSGTGDPQNAQDQRKPATTPRTSAGKTTHGPSRAKPAGNISYGRFSAASITKGGWGFEFHDVKLPIGDIEVIRLQDWLSPKDALYNFGNFSQHNKEMYDEDCMFCLPPIWLHYGLMAAAYDLRDDHSCKPVIEELRTTIWRQSANADGLYSSTLVNDGSIKEPEAFVRHGAGLPIHHPLYSQHSGSIAGNSGAINKDSTGSDDAIMSLLFEYQPHHAAKVLTWAMRPPIRRSWIIRQAKSRFGSACAVLQNTIERKDGQHISAVNTTYDLGMHRQAHMVDFDYEKFTPISKLKP